MHYNIALAYSVFKTGIAEGNRTCSLMKAESGHTHLPIYARHHLNCMSVQIAYAIKIKLGQSPPKALGWLIDLCHPASNLHCLSTLFTDLLPLAFTSIAFRALDSNLKK